MLCFACFSIALTLAQVMSRKIHYFICMFSCDVYNYYLLQLLLFIEETFLLSWFSSHKYKYIMNSFKNLLRFVNGLVMNLFKTDITLFWK